MGLPYTGATMMEYALQGDRKSFPCDGVSCSALGDEKIFEMPWSSNARMSGVKTDYFDKRAIDDVRMTLELTKREAAEWAVQTLQMLGPGEEWTVDWVNNESLTFGFDGVSKMQEFHVNTHKHEWAVYVSMGGDETPALLHCASEPDKVPELDEELEDADERDVKRLKTSNFYYTFKELARSKADMCVNSKPVTEDGRWNMGSIALVRGDQIVCVPEHEGFRAVMFFTISPPIGGAFTPKDRVTPTSFFTTLSGMASELKMKTRTSLVRAAVETARIYEEQEPWKRFEEDDQDMMRTLEEAVKGNKDIDAYVDDIIALQS